VQAALIALSEKLSNLNPENRVVLTMRTQLHQQIRDSYRSNFGKALFVKPFSPTDVYEFLMRWPFDDRQLGTLIYAELTDRPTLREMCTNPLVLAMYVAERQSGSDPITPESRTDFYRRVLDELLIKRRLRQTGPAPAPGKLREQRERILGKLAYEHLLDPTQPANSLRWDKAILVTKTIMECSDGHAEEVFIGMCRETGLVSQERERETFRFIHLTFCEFLAAFEAAQGQKDGLERLIEVHGQFRREVDRKGPSRLLEVIPFACGLVQRSRRDEVLTDISKLGDDRLLARCFLETKTYEHASWSTFVEATKNVLLNTPKTEWNERWLQDLHLFNVVVRDARQCSTHLPIGGTQIDLGDFYAELASGQGRESLSKLLAAYASHDAPAAFRLAEVSGLDLPRDFPEVIIANCDQIPFLSLVIAKMLSESDRLAVWAAPVAEAALGSRLVSGSLDAASADQGTIGLLLKELPSSQRWDEKGLTGETLYTQILTLAMLFRSSAAPSSFQYQRLETIGEARPPGSLHWRPLFLASTLALCLLATLTFYVVVVLSSYSSYYRAHSWLKILQSALIIFSLYCAVFRMAAVKVFYLSLINVLSSAAQPFPAMNLSRRSRLQGRSLPLGDLMLNVLKLFSSRKERRILSSLRDIAVQTPHGLTARGGMES
jgi:hypothetical protein